jgi:diaminopimelate epimerase
MVGDYEARMTELGKGREFYKMTGSGNDFVFFDARTQPADGLDAVEAIQAICARGTGVGADGVVFVENASDVDFSIRYYNADGTLASLCGNASLCSVALASRLIGGSRELRFGTGAGTLVGQIWDGEPRIEVGAVRDVVGAFGAPLAPGEQRMGYALVGVPHLAILCDSVERIDLDRRGRELRWWKTLEHGANANFLSETTGGWAIRTFERGVEGETLACGTGSVASAALLRAWGLAGNETRLRTKSGRWLTVRLHDAGDETRASLSGEGRLVYRGSLESAV